MIGIVVVSHSRPLGEAVVALAREMTPEPPPLAVAAGLDESTFGTDATAVASALEEVGASTDGVLVLVDIGSSVLSAEMACELIDPELAERVRISPAPLVEGIVPAVVSAAGGAALDEVASEAADGLAGKQSQLGGTRGSSSDQGSAAGEAANRNHDADQRSVDIVLRDPHGLHARPAAKLVTLVRSYDADVTLTNLDGNTGPVPATSLSRVATLNAGHGAHLRVTASGPQADEALAAIQELAERDFADERATPPAKSTASGSGLDIAIGPAHVVRYDVNLEQYQAGSPDEERARSDAAVSAVASAIREQQGRDPGVSDILDAHLALLDDDAVRGKIASRIAAGEPATNVWRDELHQIARQFEGLQDAYQQARAQDVRAVQRQVLQALVEGPDSLAAQQNSPEGSIVVLDELDPATASGLDANITGIVTVRGGNTGHGVIVARSRGIPIYTDAGGPAERLGDGQLIGFDSATREFVVDPSVDEVARFRGLIAQRKRAAQEARQHASEPAVTADGRTVVVGANLTSESDAVAAAGHGADGSGLVRTELLFGDEATAPAVDRQTAAFVALGRALRGRPITIRTWDVGGDKPLPFLPGPREANPMLGVRGLRLMKGAVDVFDAQLEAVCAAAGQTPVRVMFPMVTTRDEVDWALERLARARANTNAPAFPVGIMVEVPAAAIQVGELARGLDFVSIGTNDLTQYTLAAERGNAEVRELADPLNPAPLQLIREVASNVPDGVEVGVCGDLASDVTATALLLGLGVHDLSVVGPVVPRIKQAVRHTSMTDARRLADDALAAKSAQGVRELLVTPR